MQANDQRPDASSVWILLKLQQQTRRVRHETGWNKTAGYEHSRGERNFLNKSFRH
jgi:hypothetical protein